MSKNEKLSYGWFVYIISCSDRSLYTGITTDVQRRFDQHLAMWETKSGVGAKFFRGRKPESLLLVEEYPCRASASRREYALKKLSRGKKEQVIAQLIGRDSRI